MMRNELVGSKLEGKRPLLKARERKLSEFDLDLQLRSIPNKLFFRIGDVAKLLGVKAYVLRFWETEFPMVAPKKSDSGQRVYERKEVESLMLIKHLLYVEKFSIPGARKRLVELKRDKTEISALKEKVIPKRTGMDPEKALRARQLAKEILQACRKAPAAIFKY